MHFQFEVAPTIVPTPLGDLPPAPEPESVGLLRELLDVQREQTQYLRTLAAAQDGLSRWRGFMARWQRDFAELPGACRSVLPALEQAYLRIIHDLAVYLQDMDGEGIDNEFSLSEFLDRYGMRLGQLGGILTVVGSIAELADSSDAS